MASGSNKLKSFFGAAIALGAMTAANDASALELGCGTVAEITEALRAEGQVVLFQAYRSIPSRPKNTFTSNANMTLGYNLERGTGIGDSDANRVCVSAKYTNIKLNNDTHVSIPTWAKISPENSQYNQALQREYTNINARVIFSAVALGKNTNGVEVPTSRITVTQGNGDQYVANRGGLFAGYSNGGYAVAADFEDITQSSNFSQLAELQNNGTTGTVTLASNQPR